MRTISAPSPGARKLDQFGLDDGEYRRLNSWMAEIAVTLSPGAPVRRADTETRIGRKGSLCIYNDGGWHNFEAVEGGRGARSLIEHLRPGIQPIERRRFVVEWLRAHPGTGNNTIGSSDAAVQEGAAQHAALARQVLSEIQPIGGTLAEAYLASRGITGDWPVSLVGFVADDDRLGAGVIVAVISDAHGAALGVQLGYLDGTGRKAEVGGAERRQFLIDREVTGLRFHLD